MTTTLDKAIEFAIRDIERKGIRVEFRHGNPLHTGPYADLIERKIVIYGGIEHSPMGYMLLRHEFYHLTVFPKDYSTQDRIIRKALKYIPPRIRPEFTEEWLLLKDAYYIVSNSIVDRYGIKNDPYKELYYQGWRMLIEREQRIAPIVADLRVLFTLGGIPNIVRAVAETYEALYSY